MLPGAAYTEKRATYVNTEDRVQRSEIAVCPPGQAKDDWMIINLLAERFECGFKYDTILDVWSALSNRGVQFREDNIGKVLTPEWLSVPPDLIPSGLTGKFTSLPKNFYMTDPIARASPTGVQFREDNIGKVLTPEWLSVPPDLIPSGLTGKFTSLPRNFYMTDPITRASPTMAKCTRVFVDKAC